MIPPAATILVGTVMFGLFGAGLGAAWSGAVFGDSYSRGAVAGGVIVGAFALLAGTVWANRFAPLGVLQMAVEFQRKGRVGAGPAASLQGLAYRGLSALLSPVLIVTTVAVVIGVLLRGGF